MFEFKVSIEIWKDSLKHYNTEYLRDRLVQVISDSFGQQFEDVVYVQVDIVEKE